jgi:hypothetical protein
LGVAPNLQFAWRWFTPSQVSPDVRPRSSPQLQLIVRTIPQTILSPKRFLCYDFAAKYKPPEIAAATRFPAAWSVRLLGADDGITRPRGAPSPVSALKPKAAAMSIDVPAPPVFRIYEAVSLVFPEGASMPQGATAAIPPCLLYRTRSRLPPAKARSAPAVRRPSRWSAPIAPGIATTPSSRRRSSSASASRRRLRRSRRAVSDKAAARISAHHLRPLIERIIRQLRHRRSRSPPAWLSRPVAPRRAPSEPASRPGRWHRPSSALRARIAYL